MSHRTYKSKRGRMDIDKMTDGHIINALTMMIRNNGVKPAIFDSLVKEARKRGLMNELPNHRWIVLQGHARKAADAAAGMGIALEAFAVAVNELGAEENLPEDIF